MDKHFSKEDIQTVNRHLNKVNLLLIRVPQGNRFRRGMRTDVTIKEVIADNFPKLRKKKPNSINETTFRNVIVKLQTPKKMQLP